MRIYLLIFSFILVGICSCKKKETINQISSSNVPDFFVAHFHLDSLTTSSQFDSAQVVGRVDSISEASGLIRSYYNTNMVWSHNDGGNTTDLYLLDASNASLKTTYTLKGSSNLDWEDITVYYSNGFSYIYIGDVGDNFGFRGYYSLYAFEEPSYDSSQATFEITPRRIDFTYPDGPKNCEAIMVDPLNGDLLFATKAGSKTEIFTAKVDQLNSAVGQITLEKLGELPLKNVTAGDISQDGSLITLRTYNHLLCWKREPGASLEEAFLKNPEKLPYNSLEPQGEAFCWVEGGYLTLSEKIASQSPKLYFYPKK